MVVLSESWGNNIYSVLFSKKLGIGFFRKAGTKSRFLEHRPKIGGFQLSFGFNPYFRALFVNAGLRAKRTMSKNKGFVDFIGLIC